MPESDLPPIREDGLQLSEDRGLQRKIWRAERVGWLLFAVIILCAVLGLTGAGGFFGRQSVELAGATFKLPTVTRWQAEDTLVIELKDTGPVDIGVGQDFSRHFTLETITPKPMRDHGQEDGLHLSFDLEGPGTKTVILPVRAARPGWASFELSVGGERASASILILP